MSKKSKNKSKKKNNTTLIPHQVKEKSLIPFEQKTDEYQRESDKKIVFVIKDNYIHKKCELKNFSNTKNLIAKLIYSCTTKRSEVVNNPNIKRINPCDRNNEYKKLFCKDIFKQYESDFYEIICSDTERVFWYFIGNIFHIVLIKCRHLKIDKR